jgi:hypothetical protein
MAGRALAGGTSSKDRGGSKMKAPEGNSGAFARSDPQVRSRRDKTATIDDRRGCVARASQRMVRTRKGARLAGPDLRVRTRLHLRSRRLGPGLRDRSGTLTLQFLRQLLPARIGDDFDRSFAQHRRNRGAAVFGNALESFDHGGQRRICPGSMSNIYGRNPYRIAPRRGNQGEPSQPAPSPRERLPSASR